MEARLLHRPAGLSPGDGVASQPHAVRDQAGFTLVELLIVIEILAVLIAVAVPSYLGFKEHAKASASVTNADVIRRAAVRYAADMGFYPPDVNRGWDPGFTRSLPWMPDPEHAQFEETIIPECLHCPPDWTAIVEEKWKGPYLAVWPPTTPWGGKYDYNYWGGGANRYGVDVPAGIYGGVERNFDDVHPVSSAGERWLLDRDLDFDGVENGEAQLKLMLFDQPE